MTTHFCKWTAALLSAFAACNCVAEMDEDLPRYIISATFGSVDASANYEFIDTTPTAETELNLAASDLYSLGWGIEDTNARFLFEYYNTTADIESPPFAVSSDIAELKTQSIFYSGYWLPDIYFGINGILGAGIGYAQTELTNTTLTELSESGWTAKASIGLEYKIFKSLAVFALGERILFDDLEDKISFPAEGAVAARTGERSISGYEQTRVALGVSFLF